MRVDPSPERLRAARALRWFGWLLLAGATVGAADCLPLFISRFLVSLSDPMSWYRGWSRLPLFEMFQLGDLWWISVALLGATVLLTTPMVLCRRTGANSTLDVSLIAFLYTTGIILPFAFVLIPDTISHSDDFVKTRIAFVVCLHLCLTGYLFLSPARVLVLTKRPR